VRCNVLERGRAQAHLTCLQVGLRQRVQPLDSLDQVVGEALQAGEQQVLLVAVVRVERGAPDVGAHGDVADPERVVAALGDEREVRVAQGTLRPPRPTVPCSLRRRLRYRRPRDAGAGMGDLSAAG
jgi:hypothetical protein